MVVTAVVQGVEKVLVVLGIIESAASLLMSAGVWTHPRMQAPLEASA